MGKRLRIHPSVPAPERQRVTIAVDAPDRAFAPGVQTALMRLGYNLISRRTAQHQDGGQGPLAPRLLIVDDRRIAKLTDAGLHLPVIVLTGAQEKPVLQADRLDGLAIGSVRRRARLAGLYELLQAAFETCPRSVPRVEDALPARATRGRESWAGAIRSISEKGCLLQSTQALDDKWPIEICFPLPDQGLVQIVAQPSYRTGDRTGLIFDEPIPEATRRALSEYVTGRLAA